MVDDDDDDDDDDDNDKNPKKNMTKWIGFGLQS